MRALTLLLLLAGTLPAATYDCHGVTVLAPNRLAVARAVDERGMVRTAVEVTDDGFTPYPVGSPEHKRAVGCLQRFVNKAQSIRVFVPSGKAQRAGTITGSVIGVYPCKRPQGYSDYINLAPLMHRHGLHKN